MDDVLGKFRIHTKTQIHFRIENSELSATREFRETPDFFTEIHIYYSIRKF